MSIITCPNCKSLLHQSEKSLRCQNGHSFDIAKEGYINLLLANQKKSSNPGDNKIMSNAREAFLKTGQFDFLLDSIESNINSIQNLPTDEHENIQLLDIGCGTGFYTRNLFKQQGFKKTGIDISKIAVASASVKDKESTYLVGSAFNITIVDNSIDLLLNIFAPIDLEELKRVLKPGGYFVKVIPIGDHMKEVAELVYDKFIPHQSTIQEDIDSIVLFQIIKVENLKRIISLSRADLLNLISMTPYLYKFDKEKLETLSELSVTISFEVIVCKYDLTQ